MTTNLCESSPRAFLSSFEQARRWKRGQVSVWARRTRGAPFAEFGRRSSCLDSQLRQTRFCMDGCSTSQSFFGRKVRPEMFVTHLFCFLPVLDLRFDSRCSSEMTWMARARPRSQPATRTGLSLPPADARGRVAGLLLLATDGGWRCFKNQVDLNSIRVPFAAIVAFRTDLHCGSVTLLVRRLTA